MTDQETLYTIALTRVPRLNAGHKLLLLQEAGSATAIFENRQDIRMILPEATDALRQAIAGMDAYLPFAEQELEFAQSKHIECLGMSDPRYPARVQQCPDAPILLYYLGNADLNARHIISIIGTRQITEYGKDLCRLFMADLQKLCPDALIVSGLAYGADIHAHRNALKQGMQTLGVVAHGMDQIYPRMHRETAVEMISHGGLLTEYPSRTAIDKINFVARNRIVAGIADATIVVESAAKGGSLITARIAHDYNRDVFAFPGRITDEFSAGCNALIAHDEASALLSAEEFMAKMGWKSAQEQREEREKHAQLDFFPELTPEEQRILQVLKGSDGKASNQISIEANIPIHQLTSLLFTLEMKGVLRMMSGGMYRVMG